MEDTDSWALRPSLLAENCSSAEARVSDFAVPKSSYLRAGSPLQAQSYPRQECTWLKLRAGRGRAEVAACTLRTPSDRMLLVLFAVFVEVDGEAWMAGDCTSRMAARAGEE